MVKTRKTGKPQKSKKKVQPRPPQVNKLYSVERSIDTAAQQYAQLMRDPCKAALVHPNYSGTGQGILSRFESDFILSNGATDTASYVAFIPGAWGITGAMRSSVYAPTASVTSDSFVSTSGPNLSIQPGASFVTNVSSYRVVSACLQVSYPGSESTRAGIVSVAQTTANLVTPGTVTVATLRSLAPTAIRTPDGVLEQVLRPTAVSENWITPATATTFDGSFPDQPALIATISGIPASTGVRFRMVVVYEWIPQLGSGVVVSTKGGNSSNFSLSQTLKWIDGKFPGWETKLLTGLDMLGAALSFL